MNVYVLGIVGLLILFIILLFYIVVFAIWIHDKLKDLR